MSKFCVPKFFASENFDSYSFHDSRPKRFFYLVREPLAGEKAAIYSLKSAAENALPRTGSFEIVRCKTIAQAVYEWRRWCQDAHLTCDLTYLANIHRTPQHRSAPPPTPADSAV
ncbi:hypothetical protein B0H14DRAFT_3167414, partial [Mycena olivaceomarginata]